ncbi:MAG: TIGR01212 family radical SAM protein [Eubacteriales bacterium]
MKTKNPFPYSDSNKRYYTYDYFLRQKFGRKICKIPLDIGCTCPNADGTKGVGGCTYCSPRGSGDFAGSPDQSVTDQIRQGREVMVRKWGSGIGCIPYFQAHTNTYGDPEILIAKYEEALCFPDAVGISIATRADCLSDSMAEALHRLGEKTFLTVELGLQSVHDKTAERINRCHSYADFLKGYEKLRGLNVCIHLINGLPGESHDDMLESAKEVAKLHPAFLKLHLLHILDGTPMGEQYRRGEITPLSREAYVQTVCDQLEVLPPDVVIGRVTGDGAPDHLLAPDWSRKKFVVMNEIDKELLRRGSMQGIRYTE